MGICEYASCSVMSGSTPEAELLAQSAWKNMEELNVSATSIEPTGRPWICASSPFAWYGNITCATPVTNMGNISPHITSDITASLTVGP